MFAEVAVDAVTGETCVHRLDGTSSAGQILKEKTARSQRIGGLVWGLGMALTEELVRDPCTGHIVSHDFDEYHLSVDSDVPQMNVTFLEERNDWANPLQANGGGELALCRAPAAIINAIYNTTDVRVRDFPAKLDKILAGLPDRLRQ